MDQRVGVVLRAADAVDVAEKNELLRTDRLRHCRGCRVGVDVKPIAPPFSIVVAFTHRRNYRHLASVGEVDQSLTVDTRHLANRPQVDLVSVVVGERQSLTE